MASLYELESGNSMSTCDVSSHWMDSCVCRTCSCNPSYNEIDRYSPNAIVAYFWHHSLLKIGRKFPRLLNPFAHKIN